MARGDHPGKTRERLRSDTLPVSPSAKSQLTIDPSRARTQSLVSLSRKVSRNQLARSLPAGSSFRTFIDSLPDVLAVNELRALAGAIVRARLGGRLCLLMMG